jgi:hypothetical protein
MSDFRCFLGVFSFSAGITDTEGIRRQTACDHETPIFQRFHAPRKMFTAVVSRPARQSEAVPPPTISDRETPAPSVTAAPPTVCTDHGPRTTDHSPQRSPDPAPSPTAVLPIHQDATNEANAPRVAPTSPTESLSIPQNVTNEATDPIRSDAGPLASALVKLALLLLVGLSTAFAASAGVVGLDSSQQMPRDAARLQVAVTKGVVSSHPTRPRPGATRFPCIVTVPPRL